MHRTTDDPALSQPALNLWTMMKDTGAGSGGQIQRPFFPQPSRFSTLMIPRKIVPPFTAGPVPRPSTDHPMCATNQTRTNQNVRRSPKEILFSVNSALSKVESCRL